MRIVAPCALGPKYFLQESGERQRADNERRIQLESTPATSNVGALTESCADIQGAFITAGIVNVPVYSHFPYNLLSCI